MKYLLLLSLLCLAAGVYYNYKITPILNSQPEPEAIIPSMEGLKNQPVKEQPVDLITKVSRSFEEVSLTPPTANPKPTWNPPTKTTQYPLTWLIHDPIRGDQTVTKVKVINVYPDVVEIQHSNGGGLIDIVNLLSSPSCSTTSKAINVTS